MQFDEKWSFAGKKQEAVDPDDPADERRGETLDHVAVDPEHRLVLSVVPGERTADNCRAVVADAHGRTGGPDGRVPRLITTDVYASYKAAIGDVYGRRVVSLTVLPRPPAGRGRGGRACRRG